jgi:ligand-binding sensor domain-containing protein
MRRAVILWMMVCCAVTMMAQEKFHVKHYGREEGLLVRGATCIAQVNGFMWIGSSTGLMGYDGRHTWHYAIPDRKGGGGYFRRVTALMQTTDGTMWVGSKQGIFTLDMERERLLPFTPEGLPKYPVINSLQYDKKGNIWTIADNGLYVIDTKHKKAERIAERLMTPSCMTITKDGSVWLGDHEGTLYRYSPLEGKLYAYTAKAPGMERFGSIVSITEMEDGSLALTSANDGVVLFDLNTYTSKYLFSRDEEGMAVTAHMSITPDGESLWVGTERGIVIYHTKGGGTGCISQSRNEMTWLTDNAVHSLFADREGGVWAGTFFGGIHRISRAYEDLSVITPEGEDRDVDVIREICSDAQGRLWVGTEDGSLYLFDRAKNELKLAEVAWKENPIPFNVQALMVVGNDLWVSSIGMGLYVVDTKTMQEKRHYIATNTTGSGQPLRVVSMCQQNGTIFASTASGVYIYDPEKDIFVPLPELANLYGHHIYADHRGNVWLATFNNGLWKIRKRDGQWKGEKTPFGYATTVTFFEDSKGQYWVGTDMMGLVRYNDRTGEMWQMNASERLCLQSVNSIVEDKQHNLWLNTFDGLYSYNIDTGVMYHITTANGLPTDFLNYSAGYADRDGRVYIGSYKGLVSFDPSTMGKSQERLTPYMLSLHVNGEHIRPGDNTKILTKTLFLTKDVILTHDQNTFSIAYAVPTFKNAHLVWYRYRLNPKDSWIVTNNTGQNIQLTNLTPGDYHIELQASLNPEVWEGDTARLHVTVAPPGWLSAGAILSYVLVIIIIVVIIMLQINKKKIRRLKK